MVWDVATGQPIGKPLLHGAVVSAVSFTPDGKHYLTMGADKKIRRWPVPEPAQGDANCLYAWTHVITGLMIDRFGGFDCLDGGRIDKNADYEHNWHKWSWYQKVVKDRGG